MRVLHWCMLAATILLLVCEVIISQLCNSLIMLVDGFYTLFILIRFALLSSQTAGKIKPPLSTLNPVASPPHAFSSSAALPTNLPAESSIKPPPGTETTTDGSTLPGQVPTPQLKSSDPALHCGLSYSRCRIQAVGAFISALLLASLCLACTLEIISFSLEPQPVQRPLLLVVVSAVSLFHKMLGLWLNWYQLQSSETETLLNMSYKGLAGEEAKGQAKPGQVLYDVSQVQSAVDNLQHYQALVLCNPRTSSIPDIDSRTPDPQAQVHLHAAALQDSRDCEADLSHSENITGISSDNNCVGYLDSQSASYTSPVCSSSIHIEGPVPVRLPSLALVIQGLCTPLLSLINSLVMLLNSPQSLHSSGPCSLLLYLDPGLSLLAVVILIATATPQVHRYGLMLLQATPPHICVSDLGRRIASIPGVQAVHDLHVWQLTESFMVASVHVHCHAGFPAHRCADLMSGVTKVLQSVGVCCCTVQPEFAPCSGSSAGNGEASPVVHREDPSPPPTQTCNLACGEACIENMCCSPSEEEGRSMLTPPTEETREDAQALVIENTIL